MDVNRKLWLRSISLVGLRGMFATKKHTVNPATGSDDGLAIVACDADAEDGDKDAEELDGGLGVPCHRDCDGLLILDQRNRIPRFESEVLLLLFMVVADDLSL